MVSRIGSQANSENFGGDGSKMGMASCNRRERLEPGPSVVDVGKGAEAAQRGQRVKGQLDTESARWQIHRGV